MSAESDFQAAKVRFFMAKEAREARAPDWAKWNKIFSGTVLALFLATLAWAGAPGIALGVLGILVLMPVLPIIVAIGLVVVILAFSSSRSETKI